MSLIQRFFPLAFPAAVATLLAGCSNHAGPVTTQIRYDGQPSTSENVPTGKSTFSRIVLRGSIDVVVREGAANAIAVTGDPDIHERLKTKVEGDTLFVDLASKPCFGLCLGGEDDARVTVDLPALRAATIEGSGDLTVNGRGAHSEVDLDMQGSGDVRYTGNVEVLRCKVDGSGDLVLHGAGKRLETHVHGSGDVNASDFPVTGGLYELDGSGDVQTVVHGGDMSVQIHGSGDLVYAGELRITSLDVSGSGEMRQVSSSDAD